MALLREDLGFPVPADMSSAENEYQDLDKIGCARQFESELSLPLTCTIFVIRKKFLIINVWCFMFIAVLHIIYVSTIQVICGYEYLPLLTSG